MKTQDIFTENNKEVSFYISNSFKEAFYDTEFEESQIILKHKTLERDMLDSEIMKELNVGEVSLGEVYNIIKHGNLDNSHGNLFYVRNKNSVVLAVGVSWRGGRRQWDVDAWRLGEDGKWGRGRRAFSRNFDPKSSDPQTLGDFVPRP